MKYQYIYLVAACIFLGTHCSPKVAEQVKEEVVTQNSSEAWRSSVPKPGPARKVQMGEYNVFDLANGLKVIVVENHKLPRVSYQISLNNLSLYEGEQAGYVSFAGSLLSRGTKSKSKADIDKTVDQLGASLSTSSRGVFGSSLTKHQGTLLEVMSDVLLNPSFPKEEFEKVKTQTLSGLQSAKDDPNTIASNVVANVNYPKGHPYGEVQTEETVNRIELKKCKEYYDTYFKPNNAYLTVVGDITLAEAKANAEKYFGSWKKGNIPSLKYEEPAKPMKPSVAFANKDGAVQSVIKVTYPIDMKPGSEEALHASVMNAILGGGVFLGRLMQNLREDKAFTYGARSSVSPDRLAGSFSAGASVRTEVTDSSVVEFLYEMDRIATEPVSAKDLRLAKNSMAGSFARSLESPQSLARYAQNIVRYNLPEDHYDTYLERLEGITIADVQNIAKKYVTKDNANIVIVGNKDEIADKLTVFDGDGELDFFDAFGNKLEKQEVAIPDDITAVSVIEKYIDRLGGRDKWNNIKTMESRFEMEVMGMKMNLDLAKKAPNMAYMKLGSDAMTMQEQKYDGTKALNVAGGNSQSVTEGPVYDQIKSLAVMFKHLDYSGEDYILELKGVDQANGESCYKINVVSPSGKKSTEYYSVKSGLLLREVSSEEGPGGQVMNISQDFSDYETIEGIPSATKVTTTGMGPVPFVMELKSLKVNHEIDDAVFKIK